MTAHDTFLRLDRNEGAYVPYRLRDKTQVKTADIKRFKQGRTLAYKTKNGYNDPLSNALMLDVIVRLEPGQELQARSLAQILSAEYPQILWDSYTVGRMIAKLYAHTKLSGRSFMTTYRKWTGQAWAIEPTPEAHDFLVELLRNVQTLAEDAVHENSLGKRTERLGDPLELAASLAQA